jgi:pimeloyl-ACP methyl ester carboxylesterase
MMAVVEGSVRTITGGSLAYAQMGQQDGTPLFAFHANPGSRLDWDHPLLQPALDGSGVRLIGIDRPGFGGSTHQPHRRYDDWPADVLAVANELGIDRFGILAYSAGAPYAIACALAFPERLTFVGIVSGVGPAETPRFRDGMTKRTVAAIRPSRTAPFLARWYVAHTSPEKFSRLLEQDVSAVDRTLFREAGLNQLLRDVFAEATRNGAYGLVEEWRLLGTRSGLDHTAVQCPVRLWHGDSDALVPLHHAQHVAGLLPTAELEVLPGVGHFHTTDFWRDVLKYAQANSSK